MYQNKPIIRPQYTKHTTVYLLLRYQLTDVLEIPTAHPNTMSFTIRKFRNDQ
jgi:hypothetical protein